MAQHLVKHKPLNAEEVDELFDLAYRSMYKHRKDVAFGAPNHPVMDNLTIWLHDHAVLEAEGKDKENA